MAKRALTDAAVERIKPPKAGQQDHFDAGFPGLALRVSHGGRKSWTMFYRVAGRQRRLTLGVYPGTSLAEAREAWRKLQKDLEAGRDPQAGRARPAPSTLFSDVATEWLRRDQQSNKSHDEVERIVNRELVPAWGTRQIKTIDRRDVLDLVDEIVDRGSPTMARRTLAYVHRLFRWAVGRGIVASNPAANLPKPGAEVRRDRVLSDKELKAIWGAADALGVPFGPAIKLLILTGCRREEIGALRWSEITDNTIHLAGDRTKNREKHLIPLSKPSQAILEGVPRIKDVDLVFSTTGETPVSGWSRAKGQLDSLSGVKGWRIHDLRRTVATGLQRLGIRLEVIEAVLGHIGGSRSGVVGVYQRHAFDDEKRAALVAWGRHVEQVAEGGKGARVIPMARG
ncbi:MAG: integrase arm-type DNA-binding domain-containing protein [Candidatus Igneacidithiobacillus chanchocoensis]